jgi:hypothetical protein
VENLCKNCNYSAENFIFNNIIIFGCSILNKFINNDVYKCTNFIDKNLEIRRRKILKIKDNITN